MTLIRMIAAIALGAFAFGCSGSASTGTGGAGGGAMGGAGGAPLGPANVYSLLFDGEDSFGSAGAISDTLSETIDQFSISLWFKAVGEPDAGSMMLQLNPEFETGADSMQVSLFWASADEIGLQLTPAFTTGVMAEVFAPVDDAESWNHVVVTFDADADSGNVRVYVNGEEEGSADQPTALTAAGNVQFGRQGAGLNHYSGNLDEAVIWATVLGADEITSVYNMGEPENPLANYDDYGSASDVRSFWRMGDENVGDPENVSDLVSNNHFTVVGGGTFEMDTP